MALMSLLTWLMQWKVLLPTGANSAVNTVNAAVVFAHELTGTHIYILFVSVSVTFVRLVYSVYSGTVWSSNGYHHNESKVLTSLCLLEVNLFNKNSAGVYYFYLICECVTSLPSYQQIIIQVGIVIFFVFTLIRCWYDFDHIDIIAKPKMFHTHW